MSGRRLNCVLVAGGKWHDIDFARLELLKLLAEDQTVRVRVLEDYSNLAALQEADFLVSYTCDVTPSLAEQEALRSYVQGGRRWLALHGTNSILRFMEDGSIDTPNWAPVFMDTLGSIFQAHPPVGPFRVEPTGVQHPLVQDIEAFEVEDEQYLVEVTAPIEVLLDTEFEGQAGRFRTNPWVKSRHPVLYLRNIGEGSVCYLTLGHCRGHYDLQPLMDFYPKIERGAWELPVFYELLRRGISWAKGEL
jgi:type 1 glutamine amidotransferase